LKYRVERKQETQRDLDLIFDFLTASYVEFGESIERAMERAGQRLEQIEGEMEALGNLPHQGTLRNALLPGLRSVTKDRAVVYFEVDDKLHLVTILAVFFGGQDHQRHMISRLRGQ
jgi:plasmid stabilization system protein ParE